MKVPLTAVLLSALVLVAPATADARSPRIALAGVSYGMRPAQVRSLLGKPLSTKVESSYGLVWRYTDRLEVEFTKRGVGYGDGVYRVRFVTTESPGDRTPGGLHVGSALTQVKKLRNLVCGDYGSNEYLCSWRVFKSNPPCGPNLYFDFKRHAGRIGRKVFQIELTANNGEGCSGSNAYRG
jgi:hypothetical protein